MFPNESRVAGVGAESSERSPQHVGALGARRLDPSHPATARAPATPSQFETLSRPAILSIETLRTAACDALFDSEDERIFHQSEASCFERQADKVFSPFIGCRQADEQSGLSCAAADVFFLAGAATPFAFP